MLGRMRPTGRARSFLLVFVVLALLLAACRGEEDEGGGSAGRVNTPVVVRNATPLDLGGGQAPAAIAATAAAQAASVSGSSGVQPKPGQPSAPPPAAAGTPAPAGQPPAAGQAPAGQPAAAGKPGTPIPGTRLGIVQPAWETLRLRESELGAQVRTINTADMDDYQRNIDQLIRSGSNVIITVGVDLTQVTQDAAERNPNVKFLGIDQYQDRVLPNLVGLVFDDDKAGFLAGALAGLMTKSNTVAAVVGPGWMPTMVNMGEGFAAGAEYVNPNIEVLLEYHPGELPEGLSDTNWGRDTALAMIQDGADVMFAAGGKTGQAALEAAKTKNVFAIGSEIDQYDADPAVRPVLLTSVVKVLTTQAVQQLVKGMTDGTTKGGNFFGEIQMAPMREAEAKVAKTVRDRVQTIERGLKSGSVKTGVQTR
jgi:basic membrane protein A